MKPYNKCEFFVLAPTQMIQGKKVPACGYNRFREQTIKEPDFYYFASSLKYMKMKNLSRERISLPTRNRHDIVP